MSWIRDISDDLINLDHAQAIYVAEKEKDEAEGDTTTHAVVVKYPGTDSELSTLCVGDEIECRRKLDLIATKLPMIKV